MAGQDRTAAHPVTSLERLREKPHSAGFFRVLRELECLHRDRPRLGTANRTADDPVRLGQEPTLAFPPAALASFVPGTGGGPHRLKQFFFGLFGPNGPLPLHLTEFVRSRTRNEDDPTFAAFADLFHHRFLALFYRAWAAVQPAVHLDRPETDRFSVYLGACSGHGMPAFRERDPLPDRARLYYAGRFACQSRNVEGLVAVIADFFRVPVEVEEFVPRFVELPGGAVLRLGRRGRLGIDAVLGLRVRVCQDHFRVRLGPFGLEDYRRFLPDGPSLSTLAAVVRNYVGDEKSWDLNLVLRREEVPAFVLGGAGRLGWTSWLTARPPARQGDDLVFSPAPGRREPATTARSL